MDTYIQDFRNWALLQESKIGKIYKPKTISNYNSSLNTILNKIGLADTYKSVYDCRDYTSFKKLDTEIRKSPKFVEENEATNKTHSNALDLYARYLQFLKFKELDVTSKTEFERKFQEKFDKAQKKSLTELSKKIKEKKSKSARERTVYETVYERDADVAAYVKNRAKGICDLCGQPAPFIKDDGSPYLESHHIVWLSNGGEDSEMNAVSLCPNCHRKMHSLKLQEDVDRLNQKIIEYKKNYKPTE